MYFVDDLLTTVDMVCLCVKNGLAYFDSKFDDSQPPLKALMSDKGLSTLHTTPGFILIGPT